MYNTPNIPHDTNSRQPEATAQVRAQIAARPLLALGAAIAAGYILGRRDAQVYGDAAPRASWEGYSGSEQRRYRQRSSGDLLAPVYDEIEQIRAAAMVVAKQKLHELAHGQWDQLLQSGDAPQADRGLIDPNAERDYVKTYHPPQQQERI